MGDVNGDEVPDLLVGAFQQTVGGNFVQGQAFLFVSGPATPRWVALNILPERTQDVVPVAILTTPRFDAAQVGPLSVRLGPGKAREIHRQGHRRDVDGDGDADLVLHLPDPGGWACLWQPGRQADRENRRRTANSRGGSAGRCGLSPGGWRPS